MKKTLLALLIAAPLAATPLLANAQPDQDRFQEHALERMQKNLDLSAQQKTQIDKIFREHREEMEALRGKTHERVNAVLNEEQRAKMATMQEQRKERWEERKSEMKEKRGEKMKQ
ncbi:hypothetical protein [Alcanivorax sp. 1008]|uniref:hypothetical protein n=1 Tax=Alcanivorax sp. 1008 TaxID=2816853 RepID=UPI001DEFEF71|nr:hypothetical protein [Alcanivorax sp. 1008]MCC1495309.1 hypothetical protein [Alcanivorax sp. 1008]